MTTVDKLFYVAIVICALVPRSSQGQETNAKGDSSTVATTTDVPSPKEPEIGDTSASPSSGDNGSGSTVSTSTVASSSTEPEKVSETSPSPSSKEPETNDTSTSSPSSSKEAETESTVKSPHQNSSSANVTVTNYTSILSSDAPIFKHVNWGNATNRQYRSFKFPMDRVYFGHGGECPQRQPIDYEQDIRMEGSAKQIMMAYATLFRVHCKPSSLASFQRLFEKGFAIISAEDHSITFSEHHSIFIKNFLSEAEVSDLEAIVTLAAHSQVYVSWYTYPVASIDPAGEPVKDACFVLLVGHLHTLDLINQTKMAHRNLPHVMHSMGVKLKPVLREMRDELKSIHGSLSIFSRHRKDVARNSFAVTMGLMEFLMKHSQNVIHGHVGCAHAIFRQFYLPKRAKYLALARKLASESTVS